MSLKILIIDDEPAIGATLAAVLTAQGYHTYVACTAREALAEAKKSYYDLVLLDLGLPDADGKDLIGLLLDGNPIAILVISARHQETEKVLALDAGAQDFIDKPFGIDELLARIRVATRRPSAGDNRHGQFISDVLQIDFGLRKTTLLGEAISLSPKEFNILSALAMNPDHVMTHRQLILAGWQDPTVDPQYLRTYVGLLRQKLESDPSEPQIIVTEPGVGYRLALQARVVP